MEKIKKIIGILFTGFICIMANMQLVAADVIDDEIVQHRVQESNTMVRVIVVLILAGVALIAIIGISILNHHKKQDEKMKKIHDQEERKESEIHY